MSCHLPKRCIVTLIGIGPITLTSIPIIITLPIRKQRSMSSPIDVLSTNAVNLFNQLANQRVIVLDGSIDPLTFSQEEALCTFIERGGGLVCLGKAVEVYHEYEILGKVLGQVRGIYTPQSEIIAHIATPASFFTRRVEPDFAVFEAVYLLEKVPADAQIQWQTTWHYAPYTLAYA